MDLDFWIDPACPWCWLTSRWVGDISDERPLRVRWRPISLKIKNDVQPESPFYDVTAFTLGLLRIMESVRAAGDEERLGALYTAFGERIHHRGLRSFDPAEALAEVGLDGAHAAAAEDEAWDVAIRASMDEGLGLTGKDVGTPILAFEDSAGERVGFFGPVISRRLPIADGLALWDGLIGMARVPGFWELKRTRAEGPNFTPVAD